MNPSGTASGVRKPSFEDIMLLINPRRTPILSTIRKGRKPAAFLHQWPVRTVPAAVQTSIADGTDVTSSDAGDLESLKKVLGNRPHQLQRVAFTGNLTAELEHQYGIKDIHADNVMQFMEALKWDTENVLVGGQESGISSVTHTTRGMAAWLGHNQTGLNASGTGVSTAPYTGYTIDSANLIDSTVRVAAAANINLGTAAAASAVTEANLRTLLQGIFDATYSSLDNGLGVCTTAMKTAITNFTISMSQGNTGAAHDVPLRRWDNTQDAKTIGMAISRVIGDFGSIDLVPHTGLPNNATSGKTFPYMLVLDRDMWELLPVMPIHAKSLPDLGGGPRTLLRTAFMLKCSAPIRNGCIYTTNT